MALQISQMFSTRVAGRPFTPDGATVSSEVMYAVPPGRRLATLVSHCDWSYAAMAAPQVLTGLVGSDVSTRQAPRGDVGSSEAAARVLGL
ncbi:hypothetical protein D9M69_727500 [compost metagenome]